jgi:hypothetical protein
MASWPETDWTRGVDQVETLGVRHSGLLSAVESAAVWAVTATTNERSVLDDDRPAMFGKACRLDAWAGTMRREAFSLATSFEDPFLAAAFLQPQLSASSLPTLVPPLRNAVKDLPGSPTPFRYNGFHPEAMGLLPLMRTRVHEWETEVADATHFLAQAGIATHSLGWYSASMRQAADGAIAALEWAYMMTVKALHFKTGAGLTPSFVKMLVDAGITRDSWEKALVDLWPEDATDSEHG